MKNMNYKDIRTNIDNGIYEISYEEFIQDMIKVMYDEHSIPEEQARKIINFTFTGKPFHVWVNRIEEFMEIFYDIFDVVYVNNGWTNTMNW